MVERRQRDAVVPNRGCEHATLEITVDDLAHGATDHDAVVLENARQPQGLELRRREVLVGVDAYQENIRGALGTFASALVAYRSIHGHDDVRALRDEVGGD